MSVMPVMPEWMKVESPITATLFFSWAAPPARLKPCRPEQEAPMQTFRSMAFRGGMTPKV